MSGNPKALVFIRRLLSEEHCSSDGQIRPRRSHILVWQMAAHFVTASALLMLIGMFILIWSSTGHSDAWWNGDSKLAVAFTIVAAIIAAVFLFEQIALYSWRGPDDSEEQNEALES